jgi:DNA-binding NtrC family response regulator
VVTKKKINLFNSGKVLVIDDEQSQRDILFDILTDFGYNVTGVASGEEGLRSFSRNEYHVVITDLKMPGMSGIDVLKEVLAINPNIQVILMTAFGSIPSAVNAIKNGAYDYLTKPFKKDDLLLVVKRAMEKSTLLIENKRLKNEVNQQYRYQNLIGKSQVMRSVFGMIEKVKDIDATVLITGESGTGKELVAKAIHFNGLRNQDPFIALNCGAIPENLIESELFGHEKGSFTGAIRTNPGKFEQAQNGTIFLDEVSAMPLSLQVRLLRVLNDKKVVRVGGKEVLDLNVRIISATNEDLEEKIKQGNFRADLYHRLNIFNISLPPLWKRKEDIPLLVKYFIEKFSKQYKKDNVSISRKGLTRLEKYNYPGNIRELENIIEKTIIMIDHGLIDESNLMLPDNKINSDQFVENSSLPHFERKMIIDSLQKSRGSLKDAARMLGITYKTMQYRVRKFGIDRRSFK